MLIDGFGRPPGRPTPRRAVRKRPAWAGMRGVPALVVGTPAGARAGDLWAQGMAGMGRGGMGASVADSLTGGAFSCLLVKLSTVELALKISTAAAVGGAALSLILALRRK